MRIKFDMTNLDFDSAWKVQAIKAYRDLSGSGLKEAKEAVIDNYSGQAFEFNTYVPNVYEKMTEWNDDLWATGIKIYECNALNGVVEKIKEAAVLALQENDFDTVISLIDTIKDMQGAK